MTDTKRLSRSYTYLLRPTQRQERQLQALLGHHCDLYNAALQERIDSYQCRYGRKHLGGKAKDCPCGKGREPIRSKTGKADVERKAQLAQLTDLRQSDPVVSGFSCSAQQRTILNVEKTFQAFFKRGNGYPRFRSRARFDSVEWTVNAGASVLTADKPSSRKAEKGKVRHLRISDTVLGQSVGCIRMKSRTVRGYDPARDTIKSIRVKREGGTWNKEKGLRTGVKWYVVLSCEVAPRPRLVRDAKVGVDLGVTELMATSDGILVPNPKWLKQSADKIADLQRQRATKKGSKKGEKRSARFKELNRQIAVEHRKVQNRRKYAAWTAANYLVRKYDMIAVEDLKIANMTRSAKGTVDEPGKNVAQKSGLNKSILDAGWGGILHALDVKAECAGRLVVKVPPHNTSRTCSGCGHVDGRSRSGIKFQCTHCGYAEHADSNAARNILDRAEQSLASQGANEAPTDALAGGSPPTSTRGALSSRTCYECKQVDKMSRNGIRFQCTSCGYVDHADTNAARNILDRVDQSLASAHSANANGSPVGDLVGGSPPISTYGTVA